MTIARSSPCTSRPSSTGCRTNAPLAVESAPTVFADTIEDAKEQVALAGELLGWNAEEIGRKVKEVEAVRERFADDPREAHPGDDPVAMAPREVLPRDHGDDLAAAHHLRPLFYLTSDNPVFFFRDRGLCRPDSEMTFPISSGLLLHGSWRTGRQCERSAVRPMYVKEMNRRTASKSTRFLFYHKSEAWVATLGDTPSATHHLNEIRW